MAIRNTVLGGTDWVDGDILVAADQNDTFDEVAFFKDYIINSFASAIAQLQNEASNRGAAMSGFPMFKTAQIDFLFNPASATNDFDHFNSSNDDLGVLYESKDSTSVFLSDQFPDSNDLITEGVFVINFEVYDIIDAVNNSSVDANWQQTIVSGGTIAENATRLRFNCPSTSDEASAYWNADDFFQTTRTVFLMLDASVSSNNATSSAALNIRNAAGTRVAVDNTQSTAGGTVTGGGIFKLRFNGTANTVTVWQDGELLHDQLDISTVTTEWFIELRTTTGASGTLSATMDCFGFFQDETSVASTFAGRIRADKTTFNAVTPNNTFALTDTGNTPEFEFTLTRDSAEAVVIYGAGMMWR